MILVREREREREVATLEGPKEKRRIAMIAFSNLVDAKQFYHSE